MSDALRRASLRRQLELLCDIRERLLGEPEDVYREWADTLIPLTQRVLEDLQEMEDVPRPARKRLPAELVNWRDPWFYPDDIETENRMAERRA